MGIVAPGKKKVTPCLKTKGTKVQGSKLCGYSVLKTVAIYVHSAASIAI